MPQRVCVCVCVCVRVCVCVGFRPDNRCLGVLVRGVLAGDVI